MDVENIFKSVEKLAIQKDKSPSQIKAYVEEGDMESISSTPLNRYVYHYNNFGLKIEYTEDHLVSDNSIKSKWVSVLARESIFNSQEQVFGARKVDGRYVLGPFKKGKWEKKLERLTKK